MIVFFLITASNPLEYARNTGLMLELKGRLEISIAFSAEKDGALAEKQPITNQLTCGLSVDWLNRTSNRLIGTQTNQSSYKVGGVRCKPLIVCKIIKEETVFLSLSEVVIIRN